jgi:hypothetical protein
LAAEREGSVRLALELERKCQADLKEHKERIAELQAVIMSTGGPPGEDAALWREEARRLTRVLAGRDREAAEREERLSALEALCREYQAKLAAPRADSATRASPPQKTRQAEGIQGRGGSRPPTAPRRPAGAQGLFQDPVPPRRGQRGRRPRVRARRAAALPPLRGAAGRRSGDDRRNDRYDLPKSRR